jgi:hypothetical protein
LPHNQEPDKTKENFSKFFYKFLSHEKNKNLILILGVIGVSLIFVSNFFTAKDSNPKKAPEVKSNSDMYSERMEKSLESIVSNIKGAGNAKVLVTLENSVETVYATEEKKNKEAAEDKTDGQTTRKKESDDCEKKYITVKDSEGTEHALAVTEIQPKIKGVIVVCQGGDNPMVQQRIINAVTAALSVPSNKVYVTKSNM